MSVGEWYIDLGMRQVHNMHAMKSHWGRLSGILRLLNICPPLLQEKVGKVTLLARRKLESVDQEYGVDIAGEETAGRLQQHVEG